MISQAENRQTLRSSARDSATGDPPLAVGCEPGSCPGARAAARRASKRSQLSVVFAKRYRLDETPPPLKTSAALPRNRNSRPFRAAWRSIERPSLNLCPDAPITRSFLKERDLLIKLGDWEDGLPACLPLFWAGAQQKNRVRDSACMGAVGKR